MVTARYGQTEVMEALLNYGANIILTDKVGATALHYCCAGGNRQNF